MNRVFLYELHRQTGNRFFVGIMAGCILFAWMVMRTLVIRGIADTAPFSAWSFGYYMAQILPLMIIALLFGIWNVFSPVAQSIGVLTAATPVDERIYELIKCGAALISWLIILLCTVLTGLIFLMSIFGNVLPAGEIFLSCVLVVLPAVLFFFGAGMLAGRLKKWQSIIVITLAVIASFLPIPKYAALFGADFFIHYPLMFDNLDPVFSLPLSMIISKVMYSAAGILLTGISLKR